MDHEVSDFCKMLTAKAVFEGTCKCACTIVSEQFKDKIEPCYASVVRHSQKLMEPCPRSWLRTYQEMEKYGFRCN